MTVINSFDRVQAVDLDQQLLIGIRRARHTGRPTLVSVSFPWPELSAYPGPIDLFERAADFAVDRHFWTPPGEDLTLVGIGAAWVLEPDNAREKRTPSRFQRAAADWRELAENAIIDGPQSLRGVGPMLLGGFSFDEARAPTPLWQGYPSGRLVLPRLLFSFIGETGWLTFNALVTAATDPAAEAASLQTLSERLTRHKIRSGAPRSSRPPVILQREIRPAADWQADVAQAAETIRAGRLEKIVLARAVELQATLPFNPAEALRWLTGNYTGCYVFAIAHGARCFLGATPERLIRLQDGEILTMSLAGSSRRGATPEEDDQLGLALLNSAKDRHEHAVVVQAIVESLDDFCASLAVSAEPALLKLGNIQHICTTITGELGRGRTLFDLVEALHPTPAVGGRPREASLRLILECEKLDRGWYAGPIGWVNAAGDGEFAVALRSALLHDHTATLFAGCGIVADSDPEREYAESILKLRPMLAALGQ